MRTACNVVVMMLTHNVRCKPAFGGRCDHEGDKLDRHGCYERNQSHNKSHARSRSRSRSSSPPPRQRRHHDRSSSSPRRRRGHSRSPPRRSYSNSPWRSPLRSSVSTVPMAGASTRGGNDGRDKTSATHSAGTNKLPSGASMCVEA